MRNKGITLIALVISIIVLLILAGISISMLAGDNSILKRAVDAKERTERAQIIERAKIDLLGDIAENRGENIKKTQLVAVLNKYFKNIESNVIPDEISNINDIELTTLDGKYNILLSEIYEGRTKSLGAGLYDANDNLIYDWQTLLDNNYITVSNDNYIIANDANILDGKLIIDNSIVGIKYSGLQYCNKLTNIDLPSTLTTITDGALNGCTSLKELTLPDTITTLGGGLWYNCSNLEYLNLGSSDAVMREISNRSVGDGESVFKYCPNLKEVIVGNGVTTIYTSMFRHCCANTIVIPNTITRIEGYAFADCLNLVNIEISEGVTYIGDYAFWNCVKLKKVSISKNNIEYIGSGAFKGCSELEEVVLPEIYSGTTLNDHLGGMIFQDCVKLKKIAIPKGFKCIGFNDFKGCSSLKEVTIPESMVSIEENAFQDCSNLMEIVLPENLTVIYGEAFKNWISSQTIYVKSFSSKAESNENGYFDEGWSGDATVKWKGEF